MFIYKNDRCNVLLSILHIVMFTLTCANDNLLLTRKRCGLVIDESIFAGINVNDEIVEINHFRVESLNGGELQQQLSLPMISLLILPNDEEQLIKVF